MRSNSRQQRQRAVAQPKAIDTAAIAIVSGTGLLGILAGLAALFH